MKGNGEVKEAIVVCKKEHTFVYKQLGQYWVTFFLLLLRLIQLMEEIMAEKENKTIIFVETKKRCDELTRRMRRDGWEEERDGGRD